MVFASMQEGWPKRAASTEETSIQKQVWILNGLLSTLASAWAQGPGLPVTQTSPIFYNVSLGWASDPRY